MDRMIRDEELSTVLAALRFWQGHAHNAPTQIREIAECDGAEPLSADQIDEICERINVPSTKARLVIDMSGGLVHEMYGNTSDIDCVLLDSDIEGAEQENLFTVMGEEVHVAFWSPTAAPDAIAEVFSDLDRP